MTGLELVDAVDEAFRRRRMLRGQKVAEALPIDFPLDLGKLKDRLQLRRERETPGRLRVIQRLDAETVARQQERFATVVPDGEGKHAAELLDTSAAVIF